VIHGDRSIGIAIGRNSGPKNGEVYHEDKDDGPQNDQEHSEEGSPKPIPQIKGGLRHEAEL